MFDVYFYPPYSVVSLVPIAADPRPADLTGIPLSTSIEQDAPTASTSSTIQETQSPVTSEGVEEQLQPAPTKDFEAKYNKVKAKLALLSSSASASKAATVKNKGLIAEAYECDEEEVSLDDNEMVEVKVLIALAEENNVVSKEGARNGECMKISMRKVHTLLENLDYLCIDLNYVEEQRNNLLSKHKDLVHELNACKEQHLVLKQENFDFLTMHSNKVNQCISEQIPSQKKRILGVDQLTKDPSNSGQKDRVFVKSSADDTKVSIPGIERPWLSKVEGFILLNHDTGRILLAESQRNTADLSVVITDSSATEYNSDEDLQSCCTIYIHLSRLSLQKERSIQEILNMPSKDVKLVVAQLIPQLITMILNGSKESYLHKYEEQPGPKVVFRDDSACVTEGYGSIKCNGIVFTKVAFVNGLKYNLISISQLCDAKYIVQFDEKRETIFNSNKEIVMIAPRVRDVYVLDMTSSAQESCFFAKAFKNLNCFGIKDLLI
ncbi:hypothetical protein Tco_0462587 [Tanacetum coccineum]